MKLLLRFLLLMVPVLALIPSACEKDATGPTTAGLSGNWTWTASCGGFTGACNYPNDENYETIQITPTRFIEKINGATTRDISYEITATSVSETNYPFEVDYKLTLEDGSILEMTLYKKQNKLAIAKNMLIAYYKKD